jgi:hypothetical protein
MGKHATYRKRGSVRPGFESAPPPPTPLIDLISSDVVVTAAGGNDIGGLFWIEASETEGGPIVDTLSAAWVPVFTTPKATWELPVWLRCWEQGNGTNYMGNSAKSSWLHVT